MFDSPTKPSETPKKTKIEQCLSVSEPYLHSDPKLWRMLVTLLTQMNETTTFETPSTLYQYVAEVGPGIKGFQWCRQQNPSSFYFWDSYLQITIQKSICESHNFLNDPIIKS